MTDVRMTMLSHDEVPTTAKCRDRRRRRLEMRRLGAAACPLLRSDREEVGRTRATSTSSNFSSGEMLEAPPAKDGGPLYGSMSVPGRSRVMEDVVSVRTCLCRPEVCRQRSVHFFAVYDGHGGSHVAALCGQKMHVYLKEELERVGDNLVRDAGGSTDGGGAEAGEEEEEERGWRTALKKCFERVDTAAMSGCACGNVGLLPKCGCEPMQPALGGSTAVVAAVTPEYLVLANCGDSRAVLCRNGKAVALTFDHKPDRADELARIVGVGSRVIFMDGPRVEGILAMSRAIGDRYLKPAVTSEPEISFTLREEGDECLILASDGLWDVVSSDLACEVASKCLGDAQGDAAAFPSWCVLAAALLTRLALARKSSDNISVIVIDLKRRV